jgi:hypothetical protein
MILSTARVLILNKSVKLVIEVGFMLMTVSCSSYLWLEEGWKGIEGLTDIGRTLTPAPAHSLLNAMYRNSDEIKPKKPTLQNRYAQSTTLFPWPPPLSTAPKQSAHLAISPPFASVHRQVGKAHICLSNRLDRARDGRRAIERAVELRRGNRQKYVHLSTHIRGYN